MYSPTLGTRPTELSRHSHPRHWTETIIVSTMCRFTFGECPIITRFEGSFVYLIGSLIIGVDHIDSGYDSYFARLKLNLVPISSPFSALPELH